MQKQILTWYLAYKFKILCTLQSTLPYFEFRQVFDTELTVCPFLPVNGRLVVRYNNTFTGNVLWPILGTTWHGFRRNRVGWQACKKKKSTEIASSGGYKDHKVHCCWWDMSKVACQARRNKGDDLSYNHCRLLKI